MTLSSKQMASAASPVLGPRLALVALSAVGLLVASPRPGLWPFAFVALVPALFALEGLSALGAFGWGWLLGLVVNLFGQAWAVEMLHRFGLQSTTAAVGILVVVSAYQAGIFGVWAAATAMLARRTRIPLPFAAALAMVTAELVLPSVLFPWTLGLLIVPAWPAIQSAELFGAASVTFLLVMANGVVYELVAARLRGVAPPRRSLLVAVSTLALALGGGLLRARQVTRAADAGAHLKLGLVQTNSGPVPRASRVRKFGAMLDVLRQADRESERLGAALTVWPESAWPGLLDRRLDGDYPSGHPWALRQGMKGPLLMQGATVDLREGQQTVYNSSILIDRDGRGLGRYDKVFLLPFGEYIPFGASSPRWWRLVREHLTEVDELARGDAPRILQLGAARILPLLCYEDILPAWVRKGDALRPNLLVSQANVAWFGDTAAPLQQLYLSAFRAVELRHELVRATTTGVSGHIDAVGRIRQASRVVEAPAGEMGKPEVLLVDAALLDLGPTIYARLGDLFAYACALVVLAALALAWALRPAWSVRRSSES